MKAIIIFLLLIIVGIMGYNFYTTYQRFNPPNYYYTTDNTIPQNPDNKQLLLDYYKAIENLNGYVITQWSANDIDVRNPEDDNDFTTAAVAKYNEKLGVVKYYENQLLKPVVNAQAIEAAGKKAHRKALIEKMFYVNPQKNEFKLGEKSALIYEVQGILNEKGANIKHDGHYRTETQTAIKNFEAENKLFADGKMDALTLEALLQ